MVVVTRPEGDIKVYARMEPYPGSGLSYVDIYQGNDATAHLIVRTAPVWNDVAEALVKAINESS